MARRDRDAEPWQPSLWVARWHDGIAPKGRVLDVACGTGRHFSMSLSTGRRIVAIDRDFTGNSYRAAQGATFIEHDLETGAALPFEGQKFDGVIVTNYLHRPILPAIVDAVAATGILIYETFAVGQEAYGRPSNPDFLLRPGELLEAVAGRLQVFGYAHGRQVRPVRMVQHIAAVGPQHPWVLDPRSMGVKV